MKGRGDNLDKDIFDDLVVVKRSGQRVTFNCNKVAIAIKNAFDSLDSSYLLNDINKVYEDVLNYIKDNYSDRKTINVEDIQDIIEDKLKNNNYNLVYEAFNSYRLRRAASRDAFSEKQQHKFVKAIEKLGLQNNKNLDDNPLHTMVGFGKTISKEFAKAYLLENKYVRAHDEGMIYIHDLSYFPVSTIMDSHLDFSCIEKDDIYSYINILQRIIYSCKSEQTGEHSIDSIDKLLSPVIVKDFKKIFFEKFCSYLKIVGLYEYVNIKSIEQKINKINNLDFNRELFNDILLNQNIRNIFESSYNDSIIDIKNKLFNSFSDLINSIEEYNFNINNNKVSISFGSLNTKEASIVEDIYIDCLINYKYTNNLYSIYKIDKIDKINSKVFKLINDNKNISFSFNHNIEYFSSGEKIYTNINDDELSSNGRCILSKTSINLARLGINNQNKTLDEFYNELSELLDFTKNQLVQRFDFQGNRYKKNFPNLFKYDLLLDSDKLDDTQKIRKVLKNGVLNIGLVGLDECVFILPEKNKDKLLNNILKFINDKIIRYTNDAKLNFIVSQTNDKKVLKELFDIDKTIYGNNYFDKNKKMYSILGNYDLDNLNTYNNIQELINIKININTRKNVSEQKLIELLNSIKKLGIVYFNINCGKNEN